MRPTVAIVAALSLTPLVAAQEGYRLPPKDVVALLDAPPTPSTRLSPDTRWMLVIDRPAMPSIADVSRPWVGLAGLRIDTERNAPQQVSFDTGITLRDLEGTNTRRIELPPNARVGTISWSHSSRAFAFTLVEDDDVELWVCDVERSKPTRVCERLNTLFAGFSWMPDGERLLVKRIPEERGVAPVEPRTPNGPTVMESSGKKSPVRTYQDLLEDEHDAALFEHCSLGQLWLADSRGGALTRVGKAGMIVNFDASPDGAHLLVTTMHRPFSYVFTVGAFPERIEVWSATGALEHLVVDSPLEDSVPIEGVPTGPRNVSWRPGEPATLVWLEALDGGDPKNKVEHRDRWLTISAPFASSARELFRVEHRARGLTWFADPNLALAGEYDRDRRWMRTTLRELAGNKVLAVLEDRSVNDRYGNPGTISMETRADGTRVARQVGDAIFRIGEGESPEGARPFLDRQDLKSRATERLWRCENGVYESVMALADIDARRIVTRRETPLEPPNLHLRDLVEKSERALTAFPDPQPQIRGIEKRLVTYARADGVKLSATLYLPAQRANGERLPLVVWAYPVEFSDPSTAGQVGGSPFRFTQIRGLSQLVFATQGYAVMDDATMPIVGDPETMNDTFLEQIAQAAKAAIDHAAALGVADPARVGVGGHSYGAFMTANLLAHTDLFRAGCARSGAYNRTLTPFGFQSERRTLWEAPQIYEKLSPFFFAHQINEPLLMIHGEKDSNSGTFPMQSERLYQAIAGNGGTVRFITLPEESHGYVARESVLDVAAETLSWFDRYVKGAKVSEASAPAATGR